MAISPFFFKFLKYAESSIPNFGKFFGNSAEFSDKFPLPGTFCKKLSFENLTL